MIALCGQGDGCAGVLDALSAIGAKYQVYTHAGERGEQMVVRAAAHGMPATYRSINDLAAWQWSVKPNLIVSVGYLTVVSAETLAWTPGINCHYALLPRHRGRSSVPWAIVEGDALTGITWHWIAPKVDRGDVLMQMACPIAPDETQASLFVRLHRLAVATAGPAIRLARLGWAGVPQQGQASYHAAGPPHGGEIDPAWPHEYTERFIRAMTYPPLPYASYGGQEIRTMADYHRARSDA